MYRRIHNGNKTNHANTTKEKSQKQFKPNFNKKYQQNQNINLFDFPCIKNNTGKKIKKKRVL